MNELTIIDQSDWIFRPYAQEAYVITAWYGGPPVFVSEDRQAAEKWLEMHGYRPNWTRKSWKRYRGTPKSAIPC